MAQTDKNDTDDLITSINVTPLVDVMLVLLIIFMVTASFILAPSIKVALPKAYTAESTPVSSIAIVIKKDGTLYLNGKPSSEDIIRETVPGALRKNPDLQAIIGADKDVLHGTVIHVIDLVRTLGVTKFAINVERQEELSK